MIQWLVQSTTEHSDLARGIAPPGLLHPVEQRRLEALKLGKRRSEWLIGRWTAKHLLQACLERDLNVRLPLNAIGIYNDARGAPVAMVDCGSHIAEWAISISHSHAYGFSAALPDGAIGLGADIEHVELREWRFVEDYFTPDEIGRVRVAPIEQRETLITAIWSAEEAALGSFATGSDDRHHASPVRSIRAAIPIAIGWNSTSCARRVTRKSCAAGGAPGVSTC
jgi:4'-phosphopantetheinyl transferase